MQWKFFKRMPKVLMSNIVYFRFLYTTNICFVKFWFSQHNCLFPTSIWSFFNCSIYQQNYTFFTSTTFLTAFLFVGVRFIALCTSHWIHQSRKVLVLECTFTLSMLSLFSVSKFCCYCLTFVHWQKLQSAVMW